MGINNKLQWILPVFPALGRLRKKDHKFKDILRHFEGLGWTPPTQHRKQAKETVEGNRSSPATK